MRDLLRILAGPLLWLVAFSAVYGLHGLLCGRQPAGLAAVGLPLQPGFLVMAYILAIALEAAVLVALYSQRFGSSSPFVRFVSRTTGWVGLVATVWSLLPVATTSSCL